MGPSIQSNILGSWSVQSVHLSWRDIVFDVWLMISVYSNYVPPSGRTGGGMLIHCCPRPRPRGQYIYHIELYQQLLSQQILVPVGSNFVFKCIFFSIFSIFFFFKTFFVLTFFCELGFFGFLKNLFSNFSPHQFVVKDPNGPDRTWIDPNGPERTQTDQIGP